MGQDDGVDAEGKKQQDGQEGIPCWLSQGCVPGLEEMFSGCGCV